MEINYLGILKDNPTRWGTVEMTNEPLSELIILSLEHIYNGGEPFPVVLRELLFLAGNYCYVLDYGYNDSQEEMQEWIRDMLLEESMQINDPFFVIDVYGGSQFLFVYLNQGNDPIVQSAYHFSNDSNWIKSLPYKLSEYIDILILRTKQGRNPF